MYFKRLFNAIFPLSALYLLFSRRYALNIIYFVFFTSLGPQEGKQNFIRYLFISQSVRLDIRDIVLEIQTKHCGTRERRVRISKTILNMSFMDFNRFLIFEKQAQNTLKLMEIFVF